MAEVAQACSFTLSGTGSRWAAAAMRAELLAVASAPAGTRNHTLNRAAFKIARISAAGGLDVEDIRAALTAAALMAGLSEREATRTIAAGLGAGMLHPRQKGAR